MSVDPSMPGKHHSRATKLAATFLARLASPEVAAATFRVDVRTVRDWQAGSVELPEDQWEAIEAVLLARGGEKAASGETAGLVQTLTGAGIAARNRRYATLIARREARREGEQQPAKADPEWLVAVRALDGRRAALLGAELRHEIADRGEHPRFGPESEEPIDEAKLLAWVQSVAAAPDEEIWARLVALEPKWADDYRPDAIDGDGAPAPTVTLIEDGSPEGTRARLARDVTPGAPEPKPVPEVGKGGVWRESPVDDPGAWQAWRRYEL